MSESPRLGGEASKSAETRLLHAEAGGAAEMSPVTAAAAATQSTAAAGWTTGQIALAVGIGVVVVGGIAAAIAAGLSGSEPPHPRPQRQNCLDAELPGVNGTIGYGVDMKMGMDGGARAMFGPVLDTQCTEGWGNQLTTSSPLLYVPDSMFWFPDSAVETPGWIFHTTRGVRNMMRVLFGFQMPSWAWPDSVLLNAPAVTLAASVLQTAQAYVRNDYRLSVFTAGYRNYEKVRYVDGLLSPAFLAEANAINGDADAAALVQKYGTHVLVQATFGGIRTYHDAVNSTYQSSDASAAMNGRVRSDQAAAAAGTTLGGSQVSATSTSAQWNKLAPKGAPLYTCTGGDVSVCQSAAWSASVAGAPAPISGIVVPLYSLGFGTNQRQRLRSYIDTYLGDPGNVPKPPSVGRPQQVVLASCDCQVVPANCQCPTDTYIVGVQNDTAGILAGAMTCCRLCDSASPTLGPAWFGAQHAGGALPAPAIPVPANTTGPDAGVCGGMARLPGADRLGLAYDFFKGQLKTATVWDSTRRYSQWGTFDSVAAAASPAGASSRMLCVPSEAAAVAGTGQVQQVHSDLVTAPRDYATAKLLGRIDPSSNLALQSQRVLGAAGPIPPRVLGWFGAARHVVTHLHVRRPLWKVSLADTSGFALSAPFEELAYATGAAQVVEYYGTHFVSGVEMGAVLEADVLTDDDYYSQHGPTKIVQQAEALFAELAGTAAPGTQIDPVFRNASVVSITMNGGSPQWFPVSAFAAMPSMWAEALQQSPVVTRLELQPIWVAANRVDGVSPTLQHDVMQLQQQYIDTNYTTVQGMVAEWGAVWTGPAEPTDENRDTCFADYRTSSMLGTTESAMLDGQLHAKTPRVCTHANLHQFTPTGSRSAPTVDAGASACATNFSGPPVPLASWNEAQFGVSFTTPATSGCDFPAVGRSATVESWDDSFAGTPEHCLPGSGNNNCCAHGATAMGNRYVSNSTGDWAMTGRLLCHTLGYYMNCQI